MTPIYQTILGSKGNCFAACIASIINRNIDDIPDMNAYEESDEWVEVLNNWLLPLGLGYMECLVSTTEVDVFFKNKDFYHVIVGPTNRSSSLHHAVVGRKGKMVFDPFPGGTTMLSEDHIRIGVFVHLGLTDSN